MKQCIDIDKNNHRCRQPVQTKVDKSVPSIRVEIPPQSGSDNEKRFIWLYPKRIPSAKLCPYHQGIKEEKAWGVVCEEKRGG